MEIASGTNFDLLAYRMALRTMLDYTSPGYIFHPIEIDDGRIAIIAIGSGFDGSGDSKVVSRRQQYKMDRLLTLDESMRTELPGFDRAGQIGYYAECVLGGLHGVDVDDLATQFDEEAEWARELAAHLGPIASGERERFLEATSIDAVHVRRTIFPPAGGQPVGAVKAGGRCIVNQRHVDAIEREFFNPRCERESEILRRAFYRLPRISRTSPRSQLPGRRVRRRTAREDRLCDRFRPDQKTHQGDCRPARRAHDHSRQQRLPDDRRINATASCESATSTTSSYCLPPTCVSCRSCIARPRSSPATSGTSWRRRCGRVAR